MSKSFLKTVLIFLFAFLFYVFTTKPALAQEVIIDIQSQTDYGSRIKVIITGCNTSNQVTNQCEVRLYHGRDTMVDSQFCAKDVERCPVFFDLPRNKPNQAFITVLSDQDESEEERKLTEKEFIITGDLIIEVPDEVDYGNKIPVTVRNCRTFTNRCLVTLYDKDNKKIKENFCAANSCNFSGADAFWAPKFGSNYVTLSVLDNNGQLMDEKTITLTGTPTLPPTGCKLPTGIKGDDEEVIYEKYCFPGQPQFECKEGNLFWCCPNEASCQEQLTRFPQPSPCKQGDPDCTSGGGQIIKGCNDPTDSKYDPNNPAIVTAIGCIHTNPAEFVKDLMKFVIGISGGLAFLMMLLGAFQMLTSAGNPETLQTGRDRLTSAVIGLLFVIFAVLLLQIIGVGILNIPGFK